MTFPGFSSTLAQSQHQGFKPAMHKRKKNELLKLDLELTSSKALCSIKYCPTPAYVWNISVFNAQMLLSTVSSGPFHSLPELLCSPSPSIEPLSHLIQSSFA